jgi:hypothetical protein
VDTTTTQMNRLTCSSSAVEMMKVTVDTTTMEIDSSDRDWARLLVQGYSASNYRTSSKNIDNIQAQNNKTYCNCFITADYYLLM